MKNVGTAHVVMGCIEYHEMEKVSGVRQLEKPI